MPRFASPLKSQRTLTRRHSLGHLTRVSRQGRTLVRETAPLWQYGDAEYCVEGRSRLVIVSGRPKLRFSGKPLLCIHTSLVEPLPHQITGVYGEMLTRQPLRFLLADDPGAGKTIMAGLLIKELIARGDLHRCLVVCPGMLVDQWQDELNDKFHLPFEILTNDKLESARTGNWFLENPLAICRLD